MKLHLHRLAKSSYVKRYFEFSKQSIKYATPTLTIAGCAWGVSNVACGDKPFEEIPKKSLLGSITGFAIGSISLWGPPLLTYYASKSSLNYYNSCKEHNAFMKAHPKALEKIGAASQNLKIAQQEFLIALNTAVEADKELRNNQDSKDARQKADLAKKKLKDAVETNLKAYGAGEHALKELLADAPDRVKKRYPELKFKP